MNIDDHDGLPKVEVRDIPYLREAAVYCRQRAAMAWSEKARAGFARLAAWNEAQIRRVSS